MTTPFPFDPDPPKTPAKAGLRPKDAATLILVRKRRAAIELLMGQRGAGHVFMPDKWVFPGGRVERADALAPAGSELRAEEEARLSIQARRKPRAIALAAIRETFEETGLVAGRRGASGGGWPALWREYAAQDAAPELEKLAFVCRAITPPGRPRRFDARFFLADAEETLISFEPAACADELLHTRWFALDEAESLNLPAITRFVLSELRGRLSGAGDTGVAFVRGGRKLRVDRL